VRRRILVALTLALCVGCGQFQKQVDAEFGDQHFKTAIALIELHKVRFGEYPEALTDLRFTGEWDKIELNSVHYERLSKGYELDVVRGWAGQPTLSYPAEFWHGLGLVKTNVPRTGTQPTHATDR